MKTNLTRLFGIVGFAAVAASVSTADPLLDTAIDALRPIGEQSRVEFITRVVVSGADESMRGVFRVTHDGSPVVEVLELTANGEDVSDRVRRELEGFGTLGAQTQAKLDPAPIDGLRAARRLDASRTIGGIRCVGYSFTTRTGGRGPGTLEGVLWVDAADGVPVEVDYEMPSIPGLMARPDIRYTFRSTGGSVEADQMLLAFTFGVFNRREVTVVVNFAPDHATMDAEGREPWATEDS